MYDMGEFHWDQTQYPSEEMIDAREEELFLKAIEGPVSAGDALIFLTLVLSVVLVVLN